MLRPEPFHHDQFEIYAEDHLNSVIIIAYLLLYVSTEAHTIPQISNAVVNPPERLASNRTKYDANALVKKVSKWGYLLPEKNIQKYHSSLLHWSLTEKGEDLLKKMPIYLRMGMQSYSLAYLEYKKRGLAS